jgi:hypothetical protein
MKTLTKTFCLTLISITALSGCSAVSTAVKKRNLDVQTQMSETIWLDPVSNDKRTVFVQVRNTTDKAIDLTPALSQKLTQKGYQVVTTPDTAHYWVQTNILKLEKMDLRDAQGFLASGYGAGVSGAALGALATASMTSHGNTIAAGGLVGAAVGLVADAMVEDVNYAMITDVQIVEKTDQEVTTSEQANLKNGTAGTTNTVINSKAYMKRFQTRILSNANQVNLDFEDARPALVDGLSQSISGIF